ncbi:ParA family protein [Pseudomonas citronellolis]|uniref:ParA family protein n=1 Tax=Pseudomonas citronellolis TaxID=53408 RepID=UPI00209D97B8|nr:ParA family protein [Pseudomonas citronellolis]MCP1606033.1 chromosome partitioning protein [Pseudomonas citronellolis]MCP1656557.1 chromosome partitioning protein [Pseudomonas citronellolis]MCP1723586.1 chromosome partitioning protein [Pseudomonas citronellolis]
MSQDGKQKNIPVVSVLNMKGGVGKTTISAHLFRHMMGVAKKTILLIDFDPQFNLTQTLMTQANYQSWRDQNKTIYSVMEPPTSPSLFTVTKNMGPPPSVEEIKYQLFYWTATKKTALDLIPGDFRMVKYTLVDDQKMLQPVQKRFVEFIEKAKEEYDLICIDCNPSSSFMTLCALNVSSHLLIPVRSDRYSILGLELLDEFVSGLPAVINKPKQIVLINSGPGNSVDSEFESSLRANSKFGPKTLSTVLKSSTLLGAKEGKVGCATDKKLPYVNALKSNLTRIVNELKVHFGW